MDPSIATPPLSANNPDHLAFLAFGGRGIPAQEKYESSDRSREAKFLDSLTHLALYQSDQEVAIGATIGHEGVVRILVAANGGAVDEKVTKHIQHILDSLCAIRTLLDSSDLNTPTPRIASSTLLNADDDRPIPSAVRQLELDVLRHSLPKILRRVEKKSRASSFHDGMNALLDRPFPPDAESKYLVRKALQSPEATKTFQALRTCVKLAHVALQRADGGCVDVDVLKAIGDAGKTLTILYELLAQNSDDIDDLHQWFLYFDRKLRLKKWLTKVASTRAHFLSVVGIVETAKIGQFCRQPVTVQVLENTSDPFTFIVSRMSYESILVAAGWEWTAKNVEDKGYTDDGIIDINKLYVALAERLRRRPGKNVQVTAHEPLSDTPSITDTFTVVATYGVHCECVISNYLLQHQSPSLHAVVHVGASKPSCCLCAAYFEAAAEVSRAPFCTVHGGVFYSFVPRWRYPFGDDDDEILSTTIATLLTTIKGGAERYA